LKELAGIGHGRDKGEHMTDWGRASRTRILQVTGKAGPDSGGGNLKVGNSTKKSLHVSKRSLVGEKILAKKEK